MGVLSAVSLSSDYLTFPFSLIILMPVDIKVVPKKEKFSLRSPILLIFHLSSHNRSFTIFL